MKIKVQGFKMMPFSYYSSYSNEKHKINLHATLNGILFLQAEEKNEVSHLVCAISKIIRCNVQKLLTMYVSKTYLSKLRWSIANAKPYFFFSLQK